MKLFIAKLKEWHVLHTWSEWAYDRTVKIYGDGWGGVTQLPSRFEAIWNRNCTVCKEPQQKVIKT